MARIVYLPTRKKNHYNVCTSGPSVKDFPSGGDLETADRIAYALTEYYRTSDDR